MGRFTSLVDTPKGMAAFRTKYRILDNVELQHYELGEWLVINRPPRISYYSYDRHHRRWNGNSYG